MAYDFNDDVPAAGAEPQPETTSVSAPLTGDNPEAEASVDPAPAASGPEPSAAFTRFRTCRWQQPIEKGGQEFCTHREVKPYAGTTAFDADAWCGDCQHYKLRRIPKKRPREEDWAY